MPNQIICRTDTKIARRLNISNVISSHDLIQANELVNFYSKLRKPQVHFEWRALILAIEVSIKFFGTFKIQVEIKDHQFNIEVQHLG